MNFGENALNWLQGQAVPVLFLVIIAGALFLSFRRQFTALIGFLVFMGIIGAIVASPESVMNLGTKLWNTLFS